EKIALYRNANVLLDTQVRDGLNLGPFEFLACHRDAAPARKCGMILSEFTGCSRVLQGAVQINPWNTPQVIAACDRMCRSSPVDMEERFSKDMEYIKDHTLLNWAVAFLQDLRAARKPDDRTYIKYGFGNTVRVMSLQAGFCKLDTDEVVLHAYRNSRTSRVFFFDNEGTLAPDLRNLYSRTRQQSACSCAEELHSKGAPPRASVLECLRELQRDPKNIIVVISGRSKVQMETWFASVPDIGLAAEHGWCYRLPAISGHDWYVTRSHPQLCSQTTSAASSPGAAQAAASAGAGGAAGGASTGIETWKKIAFELLKHYVHRTQGSYIENKGSALVWQYRDSDPEFGRWQAKELSQHLREFMFGFPVEIVEGKGYIEVKLAGVNKGEAVKKILSKISNIRGDPDFVLCIGDDRSDEDMFQVVQKKRRNF
ncbi:unnamed protein product, partial [Amoebophrya sp. A120]